MIWCSAWVSAAWVKGAAAGAAEVAVLMTTAAVMAGPAMRTGVLGLFSKQSQWTPAVVSHVWLSPLALLPVKAQELQVSRLPEKTSA